MLGSILLDVVIGLVFLFCMVSVAATSLREVIEGLLKTRAIMLERGIRELVSDNVDKGDVVKRLFAHPQIAGLFAGNFPNLRTYRLRRIGNRIPLGSNLPSYVPSRNFAISLLDYVARGPFDTTGAPADSTSMINLATVRQGLSGLKDKKLQRAVLNALDEGGADIDAVRRSLERWYDSGMDRVSGWYRRETQGILFAIGLLIAALLNIDAVAVGQRLLVDNTWREQLASSATGHPNGTNNREDGPLTTLETALRQNGFMLNAPVPRNVSLVVLGHSTPVHGWPAGFLLALPGYLIVALATTLGAPFWFDLLNRFVVVRSTVKPHEKSQEESSKDRTDTGSRARSSGGPPDGDPPSAGTPDGAVG